MRIDFRRIDFIKRILASNISLPNRPYRLTLALTWRCNLECKTCFIWAKKTGPELELAELEQFFKKSGYFYSVHLTGGEPFLRQDLPDIIDLTARLNKRLCLINIATNGQFEREAVLAACKIKRRKNITPAITVSIDGPEQVNDFIRGKKGAWYKAVSTFIALKRLGLKHVYIGHTISGYNAGMLQETFRAVKAVFGRLQFNDIHINLAHNSAHYFNNESLKFCVSGFLKQELGVFKRKQAGIKGVLQKAYMGLSGRYAATGRAPLGCQALRAHCFIDPSGDIYPCTIYNCKLANIKDIGYDLSGAWRRRPEFLKTRAGILNRRCPGCWTPCEAYPAMLGSLAVAIGKTYRFFLPRR